VAKRVINNLVSFEHLLVYRLQGLGCEDIDRGCLIFSRQVTDEGVRHNCVAKPRWRNNQDAINVFEVSHWFVVTERYLCSLKFMPVDAVRQADWFFEKSDDLVPRTTVWALSLFVTVKV
jgi:hypothetical protein